jgi:hypothetical protein
MFVATIVSMIFTQIVTLLWLFWLDQEYKALNRYVQGLRTHEPARDRRRA